MSDIPIITGPPMPTVSNHPLMHEPTYPFPTYHKIPGLYKRDPDTGKFTHEYSRPEFDILRRLEWTWTEKIDGMNMRIQVQDDRSIRIAGRTDNAQIPGDLVEHIYHTFTPDKLETLYPGTVLYGEGAGPGIQKGGDRYGLTKHFILFDVWVGGWWLRWEDVEDIADKIHIPIAPVRHIGPFLEAIWMVRDDYLTTTFSTESQPAEGLVGTPPQGLKDRAGRRIITKVKVEDWV